MLETLHNSPVVLASQFLLNRREGRQIAVINRIVDVTRDILRKCLIGMDDHVGDSKLLQFLEVEIDEFSGGGKHENETRSWNCGKCDRLRTCGQSLERRCAPNLSASAMSMRVGLAWPLVGNTEAPATYRFSIP